MSRSKHTEAQMIAAIKQLDAGRKVEDVAREVGVSAHTIYAWKAKYGGMDVSEAQEAKRLRDENTRLRKLVADLSLDKDALQYVIEKIYGPPLACKLIHDDETSLRKSIRSTCGLSPDQDEICACLSS